MASYPDSVNPGQFVGTTQVYDLGKSNVNSEDFNVHLRNNFNNIIIALNARVSGYLSQEEFVNGKLFYPDYSRSDSATSTPPQFRQVFQKTIDTGALPNNAQKTIAHGITFLPVAGNTTFLCVGIRGGATDPANRLLLPLPFASPTLNLNISVSADATNVYITTGVDRTAFTHSHVILEIVKY